MTSSARRPFIWQDEMTEVREAFRRVARVKRSAFAGFSLWATESPTAETLSRNRLRRRRAQFAFELRHLNYKEPPFEAFTHLHNIRGMCSRIQRQETVTERKKKAVDLDARPALLRRPLTASGGLRADRGGAAPDRRPHSAPLPALAQVPLQYTAPRPTALYDVTHKCARSRDFARAKFGSEISPPPCSLGGGGGGPLRGHGKKTPDSETPTQGCEASSQSSPRPENCGENYGKPPRRTGPAAADSPVPRFDCMGRSRAVSSASQVANDVLRPPSRMMAERPASAARNVVDRLPLAHLKQAEREGEKPSPAASTDLPTTSNDELTASDVEDSSELTRSCFSDSSTGSKGTQSRPDSRKGNTQGRQELKASFFEEEPPRAETKHVGSLVESTTSSLSSPTQRRKPSPPTKPSKPPPPDFAAQRPFTAIGGMRQHNKAQTKRGDVDPKQRVKFASPSGRPASRNQNGSKYVAGRALHSAPSGDTRGGLDLPARPPVPEAVEDSHVLVKHSADPYADFKNSMLHMIREEKLQNRKAELEELFQYYLDLNPAVHHDVLKRVIKDIRVQVMTGKTI